MTTLITTLITVLGLLIGSFLNVVIYRVPRQQSLNAPRSHCTSCDRPLAWFENIPLLSWLVLRGRCRTCKARISLRYPVIEALTAALFLATALHFAPGLAAAATPVDAVAQGSILIAALWFVAASIALALIDFDTQTLPDRIIWPSMIVIAGLYLLAALSSSLGPSAAGDGISWGNALTAALGAVITGGLYLVIAFISPRGMGLGDVKYAALIGLVLGWHGWACIILGVLLPFLVGGLVAAALLVARRAGRKTGIPFGPAMAIGSVLALNWGAALMSAYLSLWGLA
ncbi:prepilin peptidase [Pseudoclavibacter sp. 13-3]|uniref:prepilin peptidase n=1 Tax=Pseudoclavibacter sp. 13-3 TaxID=2901228 RepID=UPI001E4B61BA|nr:A24 family peptidase [Pseudoclavibacter sp. 13-3]MCD7101131.1 prepilin peptidase [Pseudoclavibacter sp. 13-3]